MQHVCKQGTGSLVAGAYVTKRKKRDREKWRPDRGSFGELWGADVPLPTEWWCLEGGGQWQVPLETSRNGRIDWSAESALRAGGRGGGTVTWSPQSGGIKLTYLIGIRGRVRTWPGYVLTASCQSTSGGTWAGATPFCEGQDGIKRKAFGESEVFLSLLFLFQP